MKPLCLFLLMTVLPTIASIAQVDSTGVFLNHQAKLSFDQGDYVKATVLAEKAVRQTEKEFGKHHLNYAIVLDNLAGMYRTIGKYDKAVPLLQECLAIKEKELGKSASSYGASLSSLARTYELLGQYDKALYLFKIDLINTEKSKGKAHSEYGAVLVNLAGIYKSLGQYEKAIPFLVESLSIYENTLGKQHPYYGITLNNLAEVYRDQGQYDKALPLMLECLKIFEKSSESKIALEYAYALSNTATYYADLGQYEKAVSFYQEGLRILQKILGENHPDYADFLTGLANIYKEINQNEKALQLYEKSRLIFEQAFGKKHLKYAGILNNLAVFYGEIGQNEKARPLLEECRLIQEGSLPKTHPYYARTLNNLGRLYYQIGRHEQALITLQECLSIREKTLGKTHPFYANTLSNMALVYQSMSQPQKAKSLFQESYTINQHQLLQLLGFTSQQQQANYLQAKEGEFINGYSFALTHHRQQPDLTGWAYDNALFHNGVLLNAGQSLYRALEQNTDTTVQHLFEQLKTVKASLAAQYSRPIAQRYSVDELEKQAETLEQDLNRRSQTFRDIRQGLLIRWPQVQQALKPGQAAIEFVAFHYYQKRWTDSTLYAAFIIRPGDSQPYFIPLFEQKQLDRLLATGTTTTHTPSQINALYRGGKVGSSNQQGNRGRALSTLIWKPLDSLLTDIQTVWLAPAGQLHQVAFAALPHPTDTAQLLSQRYQLRQVGSTRLLARPGAVRPQDQATGGPAQPFTAELYGGIQYSIDSVQLARRALGQTIINSLLAMREATRSSQWDYLPGTRQELDNVRALLPQTGVRSYTSMEATEEQFKRLSGRATNVLHVATHGFFFPNRRQQPNEPLARIGESANSFEYNENPLLRSGLVLAGANYVWKGGKPMPGVEDGILTALEVSDLNLSNTTLVVLSACETGLGQIQSSEGVFGLQRSFKLAGAKYLLMSLWKVPDVETAEYMTYFYRQLMGGLSVRPAYAQTQSYMQSKFPQEPFKWAAFVLIE